MKEGRKEGRKKERKERKRDAERQETKRRRDGRKESLIDRGTRSRRGRERERERSKREREELWAGSQYISVHHIRPVLPIRLCWSIRYPPPHRSRGAPMPRTVKIERRHAALAALQRLRQRRRPRIADPIACAHRTGPTPPQASAALGMQSGLAHSRAAQQGSRAHVRVPY